MYCSSCFGDLGVPWSDASYYVHCRHCGTPNFVEGRAVGAASEDGTAASAAAERLPAEPRPDELNHHPHRPADFMKDGVVRGGHWSEQRGLPRYVVSSNLTGRLPAMLVERTFQERARPGVKQPLGPGLDELSLRAYSAGLDMPKRVFSVEPAREALRGATTLIFLEVAPATDAYSALTVACEDGHEALALAGAVLEVLDGLVASGATFADALFDRLGVRSDDPIAPETLERLVEKLADATHWLSGHVARVGDAVEARVSFEELGERLDGTTRVAWQNGDATASSVSLDAELPEDLEHASGRAEPSTSNGGPALERRGALEVWAEGEGVVSLVRGVLEPKLGDRALDDALHVKGDVSRAPELTTCRDLCLRLAAGGGRVVLDGGRLKVQLPSAPRTLEELHGAVDDSLRLWRRLSLSRRGVPV